MPTIHNTPTVNDYVSVLVTRSDVRSIIFDDDGLTVRIVTLEIGLHYTELSIDAETGVLTDESDIADFNDPERDPIVTTYDDVASFTAFLDDAS